MQQRWSQPITGDLAMLVVLTGSSLVQKSTTSWIPRHSSLLWYTLCTDSISDCMTSNVRKRVTACSCLSISDPDRQITLDLFERECTTSLIIAWQAANWADTFLMFWRVTLHNAPMRFNVDQERKVAERLHHTPAVCRSSYISGELLSNIETSQTFRNKLLNSKLWWHIIRLLISQIDRRI